MNLPNQRCTVCNTGHVEEGASCSVCGTAYPSVNEVSTAPLAKARPWNYLNVRCVKGHSFMMLPDHPVLNGDPRCPHCMAVELDAFLLREKMLLAAPTRSSLIPMGASEKPSQWYFDSDAIYIDVAKDAAGNLSIFARDRSTGKEIYMEQPACENSNR